MAAPTVQQGTLDSTHINALASYIDDYIPGVAAVTNRVTTSGTTTSTSFTATLTGASNCGVAFTGPRSGVVLLLWVGELSNSGANFTLISPHVRTGSTVGSGTTVLTSGFDTTIRNDSTTAHRYGASYLLGGLTAGNDYNVVLEQVVAAGTGTFSRREVTVMALLG